MTDAELYGGAGRCEADALPGRPYCAAHEARAHYRPAAGDPDPTEPEAVAFTPRPRPGPLAAGLRRAGPMAPMPVRKAPVRPPVTPDRPAVAAPRANKAKPVRAGARRVELTLQALRRPAGVTVAELHALFEQEIGPTGATTAVQCIGKIPPKHAGRKAENTGRRPGRAGAVYRLPA